MRRQTTTELLDLKKSVYRLPFRSGHGLAKWVVKNSDTAPPAGPINPLSQRTQTNNGGDVEVNTPTVASGAEFRSCSPYEASRLVFSGLSEAKCPGCAYEPSSVFLKALRWIVALPDISEIPRNRPRENPVPEN